MRAPVLTLRQGGCGRHLREKLDDELHSCKCGTTTKLCRNLTPIVACAVKEANAATAPTKHSGVDRMRWSSLFKP
jgi:hypothetical protein